MSDQIRPMGEFFDSVAEDYDVVQTSNIDRGVEYYRELSTPFPATDRRFRLLSLGAGTGLDLVAVFEKLPNLDVDAIDVSKGLLEKLLLRFPHKAHQLTIRAADYFKVSLQMREYDFVLASATLHHFTSEEKRELLEKIRHWLKPGGRIVLGDFYVDQATVKLFRAYYDSFAEAGKDVTYGSYHLDIPSEVEDDCNLLNDMGFESVQKVWSSQNYAIISGTLADDRIERLQTENPAVELRSLTPDDSKSLFDLIQSNRDHLTQRGDYYDLVNAPIGSIRSQLSVPENIAQFGVLVSGELAGCVSLIKYQPSVLGLGYWISAAHAGHGIMTVSISSIVSYALERGATEIWAGITPSNEPSIALVKRLGFELARTQESHLSYRFRG